MTCRTKSKSRGKKSWLTGKFFCHRWNYKVCVRRVHARQTATITTSKGGWACGARGPENKVLSKNFLTLSQNINHSGGSYQPYRPFIIFLSLFSSLDFANLGIPWNNTFFFWGSVAQGPRGIEMSLIWLTIPSQYLHNITQARKLLPGLYIPRPSWPHVL